MIMKQNVKSALRGLGYALVNLKYRFGIDVFYDVKKILGSWSLESFVDVGANEGLFLRDALKAFHVKRALAFEPGAEAFAALRRLHGGNASVTCINEGLGSSRGRVKFYTFPDSKKNTLCETLSDEVRTSPGTCVEIDLGTLDEHVGEGEVIDFLKIDVEGFEIAVLQGAKALLASKRIRTIYCEFHKICDFENANSPHTSLAGLTAFLAPFGYRFVALYTQGVHRRENIVTCNVLFCEESLLY